MYKTVMVYKNSGRKVTVDTHLTRKEAQRQVKEDIETNPNANTKMLVFYEM